jgi:hypothetical protein
MKDRGVFEQPLKGYTGSLKGTLWDLDAMNAAYFAGGSASAGEVKQRGHQGSRQPGRDRQRDR